MKSVLPQTISLTLLTAAFYPLLINDSYKTCMRSQSRGLWVIQNASCDVGDKHQKKRSYFDGYSLIISSVQKQLKGLRRKIGEHIKKKTNFGTISLHLTSLFTCSDLFSHFRTKLEGQFMSTK